LTSSQITQPPSHPENQQTSGLQKEKQELIARERQLWYVVTRDYFLIPDLSAFFLVSLLLAQRLKITLWHFNIAREQSPCYRGNHPTTWAMGNLGFSTSQTVELPKSDPTLLG